MAKQINNQINLSNFLNLHQEVQFFKGNKYSSNEGKKILFLGKSHYLPPRYDNSIKKKSEWYQNDANYFGINSNHLDYLNSEKIINEEVIDKCRNKQCCKLNKKHEIYQHIARACEEANLFSNNQCLYEILGNIAFSNYFLRPAKAEKSLINISKEDKRYAYEYLLHLDNSLTPDYIIPLYEKIVTSFDEIKTGGFYQYNSADYHRIEKKMKKLSKYYQSFPYKELVDLLKTL